MKTYRYTSAQNAVVHVIDEDGISRESMLASLLEPDTVILPYVPAAKAPPVSVSARQARLALEDAGLLDTINTAFNGKAKKARIEWEYAAEIRRDSPLVASMATELGLTAEQLDQLFLAADAL